MRDRMRHWVWLAVSVVGLSLTVRASSQIPCTVCDLDPVETPWNEQFPNQTRIKSPAQHMHFTAGAPLSILADAIDPIDWV